MKLKILCGIDYRILFYTSALLVLVYLFLNSAFPQYILPTSHETTYSDLAIKSIIYSDVIQYNISYLALAITFLFLLGGAFYFLNIKPLEDKLTNQDGAFTRFESKINLQIANQEAAEARINAAELRIQRSEDKAEVIQLDIIWANHWGSQGTNLYAADIISLILYLQMIVQFFKKTDQMKDRVEQCLRQIIFLLETDPGTLPTSVLVMAPTGRTPTDMINEHFGTLMGLFFLIRIPELEELKNQVRNLAIQKWYAGITPSTPPLLTTGSVD